MLNQQPRIIFRQANTNNMENEYRQEPGNLFGTNLDHTIKSYLEESAKWGKFLAIVGFVISGLIFIAGLTISSNMGSGSPLGGEGVFGPGTPAGLGPVLMIFYIVAAVLYFFPCLYLYRFSTKMRTALASDDQQTLTESFQNLKSMFRFVGIIAIILLAFYALGLIAALLGS